MAITASMPLTILRQFVLGARKDRMRDYPTVIKDNKSTIPSKAAVQIAIAPVTGPRDKAPRGLNAASILS